MAAIVDDGDFGDDDYNTLPDAGPTTQLGVGVEGKKLAEEQKKLFRVHKTILKILRSRVTVYPTGTSTCHTKNS